MSQSSLPLAQVQFALKLLKEVVRNGSTEESVFLSPFSISVALAMTYAGTEGNTKDEMHRVMFDASVTSDDVHQYFADVIEDVAKARDDYVLNTANRIYCQSDMTILDDFVAILAKQYQSEFRLVNFKAEHEKARSEINDWVADSTGGKIKDLIAQGVLDSLTRLVLVNAIYFKGSWKNKFDESLTETKQFLTTADRNVNLSMMHMVDQFLFGQNDQFKILGIPYKGDELSLLVFLPHKRHDLSKSLDQLDAEKFASITERMSSTKVNVTIPKFKLEDSFELTKVLHGLGMSDLFSESKANFSKMTTSESLFVSNVIHKSFIEVNEEGTEAAAATAVVMKLRSIPRPPPIFLADHPFLFTIFNRKTHTILFAGCFYG